MAHWRSSDVYDERERAVLEYAEAATKTPAEVGDDLVRRLHERFSDEGFSDNCKVPDDASAPIAAVKQHAGADVAKAV